MNKRAGIAPHSHRNVLRWIVQSRYSPRIERFTHFIPVRSMSLLRILAKRSATLANPAARRTFVSFSAPRFEEGGEEATQVNLNFTSPGASIYTDTAVDLVIIPGVSGDYGVTAGHTPTISELRPGTVGNLSQSGRRAREIFHFWRFCFYTRKQYDRHLSGRIVPVGRLGPRRS